MHSVVVVVAVAVCNRRPRPFLACRIQRSARPACRSRRRRDHLCRAAFRFVVCRQGLPPINPLALTAEAHRFEPWRRACHRRAQLMTADHRAGLIGRVVGLYQRVAGVVAG